MSDQHIRNFLQRAPHPHKLRTDSGELIVVSGRNKWAEAMSSINALSPATLEALDRDGNIIRTLQLDGSTGKEPRLVEDQLVALARIITKSNDDAVARHAGAYQQSFSCVVQLMNMMSQRLSRMESAYMAMVTKHAETLQEVAQNAGEGELDGMLGSFLAAKLVEGVSEPKKDSPPNGQSNGKK